MSKKYALSAVAVAVGATFCAAAGATTLSGAGASAINNTLKAVVLGQYCTPGTVAYYDNDSNGAGGGSVYRITCTSKTATKFATGVDISYDTTGGSWKGFLATNTALMTNAQNTALNANPASTINTGACGTVSSSFVIAGVTVSYHPNCSVSFLPASTPTNFGMTDVESALFNGSTFDQPLVNNSWNGTPCQIFSSTLQACQPSGTVATPWGNGLDNATAAFGVVFGVAASKSLYLAMQKDQIGVGWIPSSCSGTVATAGVNEICAPLISRSQYASLVGVTFQGGNTSASFLFQGTPPTTDNSIELARRDQGSGTQSGSNAHFLNVSCTTSTETPYPPALPSDFPQVTVAPFNAFQVTFNATTGDVITRLAGGAAATGSTTTSNYIPATPTSGYVIGVVSDENDTKLKGGAGFLRLDGFYPSTANAASGMYTYVTEENLHCSSALTAGDNLTFCQDLAGTGTTSVSLKTYTGTGILQTSTANYNLDNDGTAGSSVCQGLMRK